MASHSKTIRNCDEALALIKQAEALLKEVGAKDAVKRAGWAIAATAGFRRHTEHRLKETTK